jgi:hypothetical protein
MFFACSYWFLSDVTGSYLTVFIGIKYATAVKIPNPELISIGQQLHQLRLYLT